MREGDELPVVMHHVNELLIFELFLAVTAAFIARFVLARGAETDDVVALVGAVLDVVLNTGELDELRRLAVRHEDVVICHGEKIVPVRDIELCKLLRREHAVGDRGMAVRVALQPYTGFGEIGSFHAASSGFTS